LNPLSVVHFSTADVLGGSARSAYRIHSGLRERGLRSRMLVGVRASTDPDVDTVWRGRAGRVANRLVDAATRRLGYQYAYFPSTRRVLSHPWVEDADVLQVYNTHGGYFETSMLARLSARAPIVWRLSDMWALTGHCAYSGACERWRTGCGECPDLATWPAIGRDRTARLWREKDRIYRDCCITVVAPSSWTERLARASPLLGRFPIERIPNGIDLATFSPRDRRSARAELGIDPAAKVIAFVAHGLDANPRKGTADAIEALGRLATHNATVLLAGEGGESWAGRVPFPVKRLGFVRDERVLADIYNSADLLLAPSRVENLPNTVLEALACALPVVACDAGGMRDAVRHMETGWLAHVGDAAGLAKGMDHLLGDDALRGRLSMQARRVAEREFSRQAEVSAFEALYRRLVA
jgi:glycosyltransferase involved in cell wall biosynthesis